MGLIAVANINHFANPPSSANIPRHISSIIWSLKTKLTEPDNRSSNNNNISNKSTITHRIKGVVADTYLYSYRCKNEKNNFVLIQF